MHSFSIYSPWNLFLPLLISSIVGRCEMTEMGEIGGKRRWLKIGESSSCAKGDLMVLHCKKLSHWKFQLYCTAVHQHFFQVSASGEPSSGHSLSFVGEELGCSFLCYQLSLLKGPSQWMEYHSWNGMDRLGAPSTAQAQGELPHYWCGLKDPEDGKRTGDTWGHRSLIVCLVLEPTWSRA